MLVSLFELSIFDRITSKLISPEKAKIMALMLTKDIKRKMSTNDFKRNEQVIKQRITELIGDLA